MTTNHDDSPNPTEEAWNRAAGKSSKDDNNNNTTTTEDEETKQKIAELRAKVSRIKADLGMSTPANQSTAFKTRGKELLDDLDRFINAFADENENEKDNFVREVESKVAKWKISE